MQLAKTTTRPPALVQLNSEHHYFIRLLELLIELVHDLERGTGMPFDRVKKYARLIVEYFGAEGKVRYDVLERVLVNRLIEKSIIQNQQYSGFLKSQAAAARRALELAETFSMLENRPELIEVAKDQTFAFVESCRNLIHFEKEVLLDKAQNAFSTADWDVVDAGLADCTNTHFSNQDTDRFREISSYMENRYTEVSTFDRHPMILDALSKGLQLLGIWNHCRQTAFDGMVDETKRFLGRQIDASGNLLRTNDFESAARIFGRMTSDSLSYPGTFWAKSAQSVLTAAQETVFNLSSFTTETRHSQLHRRYTKFPGNVQPFDGFARWKLPSLNIVTRMSVKALMRNAPFTVLKEVMFPIIDQFGVSTSKHISIHNVNFEGVKAEWITVEESATNKVLFYLPGGGFLMPATQMHRQFVARLAAATGAAGLLVHYRLAPDYPFPTGLEDAILAYRDLLSGGIDPANIVVAGDSAGGGLLMSMLMALRDAGDAMPAAAVVLSPLADLTFSGQSREYNRWHDPMLPTVRNVDFQALYVNDHDPEIPLISPVFGDFSGFPPILAQVGSTEILLDDTLRIATKARSQGVSVDVEIWNEMPHVWHLFSFLAEAGDAVQNIADFVNRHVEDDNKNLNRNSQWPNQFLQPFWPSAHSASADLRT